MLPLPDVARNRKKELKALEKNLSVRFRKIQYLQWALQHRSYVNEFADKKLINNEQLEFLGDSILGHFIAHYLFEKYPHYSEGKMSILKSSLVNQDILAKLAIKIDLGSYLLLGKGEEKAGGRERSSILADALEAVIASYYLDRGFKPFYKFLTLFYRELIEETVSVGTSLDNAKNRLQKLTQSKFGVLPEYRLTAQTGPEHKKTFEVRVFVRGTECGTGDGLTKKKAEESAAVHALKKMSSK